MKKSSLLILLVIVMCFTIGEISQAVALEEAGGERYCNLEAMLAALNHYQKIAEKGGWSTIPAGPSMKIGEQGKRVILLRQRLMMTGDLSRGNQDLDIFDEELREAVCWFQERHGLFVDGIIGKSTLSALNLSVQTRIRQITSNLNKMKDFQKKTEEMYIVVNIPDFKLKLVSQGEVDLEMRVIVGRVSKPTPVFDHKISYLVFNPTWVMTYNTALYRILPLVKKNSDYFRQRHISVYAVSGNKTERINPGRINWQKINSSNFRFQFIQQPGPLNPMGVVKFKFPNRYHVYLHDTPDKDLFNSQIRTFSLGCVRLEKAVMLAEYILKNEPGWNLEKIAEILKDGRTKVVNLVTPVPVHLVYWTVWATDSGVVHFRKDIYK